VACVALLIVGHNLWCSFVQEYFCTIRTRISKLAFREEEWCHLDSHPCDLAVELVKLLDRFGLPFLDQFSDYDSVLAYYDEQGRLPFRDCEYSELVATIVHYFVEWKKRKVQ
jgi:hypothetical protein